MGLYFSLFHSVPPWHVSTFFPTPSLTSLISAWILLLPHLLLYAAHSFPNNTTLSLTPSLEILYSIHTQVRILDIFQK